MKNVIYFFALIALSACTASSYYSSPNANHFKDLGEIDTVYIYSKTSSVIVEDNPTEKNELFWRYSKSLKENFSITTTLVNKTLFISDTLSKIPFQKASELKLNLAPYVVVAVLNDSGTTIIHHSGVTAVQSGSGSINYFLIRNHFKAESLSGNISVKLDDAFDHSGFVRSESGHVSIYTGNINHSLSIDRKELYNEQLIQKRRPLDFKSVKPPYLFIECSSKSLSIESAGTVLW